MKQLTKDERKEIYQAIKDRREAVENSLNASDPGWRQRIVDKANKLAIGRLKVEKEVTDLKEVEEQIRQLELKKADIEAKISKKMPLKERDKYEGCPMPKSLCESVAEIVEETYDSVMAKDPSGQKVLEAEAEFRKAKEQLALCDYREDVVKRKIL